MHSLGMQWVQLKMMTCSDDCGDNIGLGQKVGSWNDLASTHWITCQRVAVQLHTEQQRWVQASGSEAAYPIPAGVREGLPALANVSGLGVELIDQWECLPRHTRLQQPPQGTVDITGSLTIAAWRGTLTVVSSTQYPGAPCCIFWSTGA